MAQLTKKQILKLTKTEIDTKYRQIEIGKHCLSCSDCSYCSNCSSCSYCSYCSYCYACYKQKDLKYAIANVVLTKEEYEIKMKELKG